MNKCSKKRPQGSMAEMMEVPDLGETLENRLSMITEEIDLEKSARENGALIRRRGVKSASKLLRIVLGYSVLDHSLRMLGIWCTVMDIAYLSKTALLKRLRCCRKWLGKLVMLALVQQKSITTTWQHVRVKVLDATVICQPGSKGADWRLHFSFDLRAACLDEIEITDGKGPERFNRFTFQPGEICLGDRAYAIAKSLGYILYQGAWVVVRTGWNRLSIETEDGQRFDLIGWLKDRNLQPEGTPGETQVWISTPQGRYTLRLVAQGISHEAAEKARRKARKAAKKNHHTPDERSLYTAGFILLLSNLPHNQWSTETILQLYRFRWQVELAFKRFKSLLHFDHLRCKDPELVQVYLLGKLLGLILVERIQLRLSTQHPGWFMDQNRPMSYWRLTALFGEEIRMLIRGPLSLEIILQKLPLLLRYLCDEPRNRSQQLVTARRLFQGLGNC
mgnify:CR=1 FL=1